MYIKILSEYDQDLILHADQPISAWGRATEH